MTRGAVYSFRKEEKSANLSFHSYFVILIGPWMAISSPPALNSLCLGPLMGHTRHASKLQTVRSIKIPSNPSSLFFGKVQKLYLYLNPLTPDWQTDSHQTMIQNIKIPSNPSALFFGKVQTPLNLSLMVQKRHS